MLTIDLRFRMTAMVELPKTNSVKKVYFTEKYNYYLI